MSNPVKRRTPSRDNQVEGTGNTKKISIDTRKVQLVPQVDLETRLLVENQREQIHALSTQVFNHSLFKSTTLTSEKISEYQSKMKELDTRLQALCNEAEQRMLSDKKRIQALEEQGRLFVEGH